MEVEAFLVEFLGERRGVKSRKILLGKQIAARAARIEIRAE
jgi:hypothetical protein